MQDDNAAWMAKANSVRRDQIASLEASHRKKLDAEILKRDLEIQKLNADIKMSQDLEMKDEDALESVLEERREHIELISILRMDLMRQVLRSQSLQARHDVRHFLLSLSLSLSLSFSLSLSPSLILTLTIIDSEASSL